MVYYHENLSFHFHEGDVHIVKDGEEIATRYIGFDTCEKDFVKWCKYYLEEEYAE